MCLFIQCVCCDIIICRVLSISLGTDGRPHNTTSRQIFCCLVTNMGFCCDPSLGSKACCWAIWLDELLHSPSSLLLKVHLTPSKCPSMSSRLGQWVRERVERHSSWSQISCLSEALQVGRIKQKGPGSSLTHLLLCISPLLTLSCLSKMICANRNYLNSTRWIKRGFSESIKLVIKPTVFWSWFEYYMYFWLSSLTGLNLQN